LFTVTFRDPYRWWNGPTVSEKSTFNRDGTNMAKIKKRRLRWRASDSPSVIGYKLYWTEQGDLGYDSHSVFIGNVTQVVLPDQVPSFPVRDGSVTLGLTAVNEIGNESDLITLTAHFQFSVPLPPSGLSLEALAEYHVTVSHDESMCQ
jgi:hypothetical protein